MDDIERKPPINSLALTRLGKHMFGKLMKSGHNEHRMVLECIIMNTDCDISDDA
jgi:hypothetical protein